MITLKGIDSNMIANNLTPSEPIHPLNGKRPISAEYALLFEAALGLEAAPLLKMQAEYNMQKVKSDKTFLERLASVRKFSAAL